HLYPKNVGTIVEKPVTPTKPKKPSKLKKRLPQTGEAKSFLGILGILLIGTAIILWRKHSVRNN
ncbi:LPXTG cell wall anchor domain-containing protein, partial [Enterococcus faecium]|uniref:LPXTG cell wall anchor domain-containing protein n=2 Tax=Enterococcus TaxID=1350 RepID=UPI003D1DDFAE